VTRPLRIAVPESLARLGSRTGHGRVWSSVLEGVAARAELTFVGSGGSRFGRRRRPDVWLASGHEPPPDTGGVPLVVEVHEASWEDPSLAVFLDPAFSDAMRAATAAAVSAASAVITLSEWSRRQIIEAYGASLVTAIAPGVDAGLFRPGLLGGREEVGGPYVLFVGTVHPRKNLPALRDAIGLLAAGGHRQVLALAVSPAGDRADSAALMADAVAQLPGFPGRVVCVDDELSDSRVAMLMSGADALCLPSFGEGFGLPALEAMACGIPVVVAARGALPEVVGDAGVSCEPAAEAIAAALGGVLDDPGHAASLGAAARERALEFSWERTVDGWLAVLERAARGG
jgi:glycosyltransferase involved in cell wall biosynthesis